MTRWFRYYDDALNDPKVQTLPGDLFKTWVNLLCVASRNNGQLGSLYELTYLLRMRSNHVEERLNKLVELGLVDLVDDHFEPHNWRIRQYKSDNSTERSQRHRAAKRNVAEPLQQRPQSTETDTEAEKKKERTGKTILPDSWLPSDSHFQLSEQIGLSRQQVEDAAAEMRGWSLGNGEKRRNWDWVFNNWLRRNAKNGRRGQGPLQDDRSASRAAGRLAEAAKRGEFTFGPRPGLLPRTDSNVVSLLSARRDDEP